MIFCRDTVMEDIKKKIRKFNRTNRKLNDLQKEYDQLEEEYNQLEEKEEEEENKINKMILELERFQTGRKRGEIFTMITNNKAKLRELYKTIVDEIQTEKRRVRREQRRIKEERHTEERRIRAEERRIRREQRMKEIKNDLLPPLEDIHGNSNPDDEGEDLSKYISPSSSSSYESSDISTSPEPSPKSRTRLSIRKGGKRKNNKTKKHKNTRE
jgi:hypothetical protein